MDAADRTKPTNPIPFKAETRQLLDILIHSLYTEREVFLRELISNASDALTRMNFEMLTNRQVLDPEAELAIWIETDSESKTLTMRDTGIGMTAEELGENLGTIAHSGARAFLQAVEQGETKLSDMIGQFGVGFYSAFMIADSIRVVSRSFSLESEAAAWVSTGADTFFIEPAEKKTRGTEIIITLKEDAGEFLQESRLREIIRRHSDYIPFPIYLGEKNEQANRQTAIWRQQPRQVEEQQHTDFYKQLTMEFEPPLTHLHLSIDAPVQMYALLYFPASPERSMFSNRKQEGLALYARKVLLQEYCKDLLPEFFRFVVGVVDSEDIPLNVSRESVQSTRLMGQLKKLITTKLIEHLKGWSQEKAEDYQKFWKDFGRFIKEGVAVDPDHHDALLPLLRFHTLNHSDTWCSFSDYVQEMKLDQKKIFFILGDDERSLPSSPHLEIFRKVGYDVILLGDPVIDPFMLLRLNKYQDFELGNVSNENLQPPEKSEEAKAEELKDQIPTGDLEKLVQRFKTQLGERVADVRTTERLVESPARVVDENGKLNVEMQRVYRMLNREFETPRKVLEINPQHPILKRLSALPDEHTLVGPVIEQIYEDALLIEGLHPDPASMIQRIQRLIEAALE